MILYRFAHQRYCGDISGEGAKLYGGRWNPAGIPVIYTSSSISLALLELIANSGSLEYLQKIHLMQLQVPDDLTQACYRFEHLKKNWFQDMDYTQWLGNEFLQSHKSLLCACPSAIVHQEWNYLLNPLHPAIKKIILTEVPDFNFDERLFRKSTAPAFTALRN